MTLTGPAPTVTLDDPPSAVVTAAEFAPIRARLIAGVADAAADLTAGSTVIGLPLLRRARYQPEALGRPDEPFSWKPAFVRRSLGIAAIRACADRRFRSPADAVGPLADAAVDQWRRSGWRTFHWEPWFDGLGAGGQAAVLAAAVTWATPVWATTDWRLVASRAELGRPDVRWAVPDCAPVELRGRSEASVALPGGSVGAAAVTLLSVSGGCPGDGWHAELAFLALVDGLASPTTRVPVRVVGLWPEAGVTRTVEIDEAALCGAVDRVVGTVAVVGEVAGSDVLTPAY